MLDDALVRINGVLVRAAADVVSAIDHGLDLVDGRQIDAPGPQTVPAATSLAQLMSRDLDP